MGTESSESLRSDQSSAAGRPLSTKHGRLRDMLAQQILGGRFSEGQFLPSEPSLAKQFDMSRGTVRQALAELQNQGYVERIPGKGTLVCGPTAAPTPQTQVRTSGESKPGNLSVFAVVLPEMRTGHYPALVHSFDEAAAELHHQILCCTTGNDVSRQGDIILQLIDKHVAGVALSPPTVGAPPVHQIRQLQNHGIPVVLLHRPVEGISAPVIEIPYEQIARMAAEALIAEGHRRIGVIASHRSASAERYLTGLADAMHRVDAELPDELIHCGKTRLGQTGSPGPERLAEIEASLKAMLSLPAERRPTAVFDPWDADAEAVYLSLTHLGISVPKDFSLISFGGASRSGALSSRISSITVDESNFARQAVTVLEKIHRGETPMDQAAKMHVDVNLYPGQTIAPPARG